ncbi:hypothetical protein E2C01_055365 [Portunus trituberculatus]|uniref:Uncharacterized protein n=1 Tax=Portunus trituberculatus TaxID=210409 RepID=A0A5B7GUK8_PORTR|nr:hypothetical protein [Portunus trituberculatus]
MVADGGVVCNLHYCDADANATAKAWIQILPHMRNVSPLEPEVHKSHRSLCGRPPSSPLFLSPPCLA